MNSETPNENTKTIFTSENKRERSVSRNWNLTTNDYDHSNQMNRIVELCNINDSRGHNTNTIMQQQIQTKIKGYKAQDVLKHIYNEAEFVEFADVLKLMFESQNMCYYCKNPTYVLYEIVREPKQWTLERLDNKLGHNRGNVVIACLDCNLRRKTMYHERFAFTKQLNIIKKY